MAAGHLTAALTTPAASPVLAVGVAVIDRTPTPLKEWAIEHFGTHDKQVLLGSVVSVTCLLAGIAGLAARRRLAWGLAMLTTLVAVAGAAAAERPAAHPADLAPAVVAGIVGVGVLGWCGRLVHRTGLLDTTAPAEPPIARSQNTKASAPHPMASATPADLVPPASSSRRTLLLTVGAVAALSAVGGWAGVRIERARVQIRRLVLPRASSPAPPLPTGLEHRVPGVSPLQTPTADFYRVDVNLSLPLVQAEDWDLRVEGDVDHPFTLTFAELTALELVERDITLTCVSNEVGGQYVGAARWLGAPVRDLLERAGVRPGADQVLSTAQDGFTISTPLSVLTDGRDALVAIGMNGEQLPPEHGFPARLVTPGLYGYTGATKWLRTLTVTTFAARSAYWTERGWATQGPIKVSSRIDTPAPLARVRAGTVALGGVAWAQHDGVARVQVRIDGGPWREARLGPDVGIDYWRQWFLPWQATPGTHAVAVRATTTSGIVQTAERVPPFPSGSTGIQEIRIRVE